MKKIFLIIFFIIISILICIGNAYAKEEKNKDLTETIIEQFDKLDLKQIEDYIKNLSDEQKSFLSADFKQTAKSIINGDFKIGYENIFKAFFKLFFDNVLSFLPIFATIFAIVIICNIINNFKPQLLSDSTNSLIYFICYSSILLLIILNIYNLYTITYGCITSIKKQMDIAFPVLITLMLACGGDVSVTIFRPATVFLSNGIVQIFLIVILPLSALSIFFCIIGNLSDNIKLDKFVDLFKSIIKWILGITFTIFTLFISVQGLTSANFDGITLRTAKYAIGNSIPIIGGFLKDGFDLILAGSILIKNSIGNGCIILLLIIIFKPIVLIASYNLFLKMTAAVIEPISDRKISTFLTNLSTNLNYFTTSILGVGFMYFINLLLIICSSNYIL